MSASGPGAPLPTSRVLSHLAVMGVVSVVMGIVVAGLAIPFAGVLGLSARDVSDSLEELPADLQTETLPEKTRILDVNGNLVASLYDENRVNVPLNSISRTMVKAIVSIEDYRFYSHGALDIKGTLRALVTNSANSGVVQGGSSITQQMVKLTLLSQADTKEERKAATDDTYARKLRELRYAIAFEHKYSKDWILERYLNIAYFGDGAFGVQAAARHYFSKNASKLTLTEAAMLAGLVKNPTGYDPTNFPDRAFERRKLLYSGGLTNRTTVDLRYQEAADRSVRSHVDPTDQAIGGLAMVEPRSGDVRALAQSRPMGTDKKAGQTYLNYVVPKKYGDANGFQAGSTFKAFVLATAIDKGIPLNTTFESPAEQIMPYSAYKDCDNKPLVGGVWDVHNSTDSGRMNMYTGTQLSVNTYFAQLEALTGVCEPYRLARTLGVELTDPTNQMVPSFTLGVVNTDPLTMASAYATFAGRGMYCTPRPVTALEDANGNLLKEYPKSCRQVLPSAVADAVNDILKGVQEPGGFGYEAGISLPGRQSAGKTGTINDNMAVWFIGYTPALATASMIAGANQAGHWITLNGQVVGGSYVVSAHGSTTAGPMWGDAMKAIEALLPNATFVKPSSEDIAGVLTGVPDVSGMTLAEAKEVITEAGFRPAFGGYVHSSLSRGLVSYTSPSAGEQFAEGDVVSIYLSDGTPEPPPNQDNNHHGPRH